MSTSFGPAGHDQSPKPPSLLHRVGRRGGLSAYNCRTPVYAELAKLLFKNLSGHELEAADDDSRTILGEFMSAWMKLERELRNLTQSERASQLRTLAEKGLLDNETMRRLFQFRNLRDQVVHGEVDHRKALHPHDATAINEITRKVRGARGEAYRAFFESLVHELRERHGFPTRVPPPRSFCCFASGFPGILHCASFTNDGRARAEIYIDVGDTSRNKRILERIRSASSEIQAQFEEPLSWEPLEGKRASRIALYTTGNINMGTEELARLRSWFVDRMPMLKKVFAPRLAAVLG